MRFARNNLDHAASPYLRQHADNPVWWQQWDEQTLTVAREENRILFVSVGYSTCHWCHVMAREAFSDDECARILNERFLAIKVDREERPDIDHYLMSFLVATSGGGGWPLNAFLTPDGRPFFAMTYASTEPRFSTPGFADILRRVVEFYDEHRDEIRPFELNREHSRVQGAVPALPSADDESEALERIHELERAFDDVHAGFGTAQKFPPHSALLFLQYAHAAGLSDRAGAMVTRTLDEMMTRGLHDHLQGGFFRYCVDREWTIPHFEKMLYDQAMLLWNYSVASRLFGRAGFRDTAAGLVRCLEETFRVGDGYASAHDADTNHREGATYLWRMREIEDELNEDEIDAFLRTFAVTNDGNFEGRNHLVRILAPGFHEDNPKAAARAPELETIERAMAKLLAARDRRDQPSRDEKIILGWNALAGCALLAAYRYAGVTGARERAEQLAAFLVDRFVHEGVVLHVLMPVDLAAGSRTTEPEFLHDVAALLLFLTMLAEESPELDERYGATRDLLRERLAGLQLEGAWMEGTPADFPPVPAEPFDQPMPSGISLAEYATLLGEVHDHHEYAPRPFAEAHGRAFANITALASRGYVYVVESPKPIDWSDLPVNAIQVPGETVTSCYRGVCRMGLPGKSGG
ncbi:MAG: thioredoxin domain-containing protein [Spirochaetota bacterium]